MASRAKPASRRAEQPMYDFAVLRELRRQEGLTIGQVAARSGVSAAVISKLERNRSSAELGTLFRLSRVFGVSTTDLVALAESRTSQRVRATSHTAGGFAFSEVRFGNCAALLGEARAGSCVSRPEIHRDDYEVCWVVSGRLALALPHERHELAAGDAIQFDAMLHHTYEALSACRVIILHLRKRKRFQ